MRGKVLTWVLVSLFLPATASLRAADAEAIQRAVDRGVEYLKRLQKEDGTWPRREMGATALAGLTLLECGVAADDPAVQKAAAKVREASINETATYSLSLALMFLDRLGDPRDVPFLESLTVKLLAGQNASGGWSYTCPALSGGEVNRLTTVLKQRNELVATKELPRPGQRRDVTDLPREIQEQLDRINRGEGAGKPGAAPQGGMGDNSNTQFAIMALWMGHRHGVPVEKALARVDARFRSTQLPDGGWNYQPTRVTAPPVVPVHQPGVDSPLATSSAGNASATAMTCAGLLGLALASGSANEGAAERGKRPLLDPGKDPIIKNGLLALGATLDIAVADGKVPVVNNHTNTKGYYILWSLERMAVAYGLDTIGNKNWYDWGANVLLHNQQADGGWVGEHDGGCDTCFALLFLKKANLVKDLTATLKGKVSDPGQRELRTGGTSGADIIKSRPVGGDGQKKPDHDKPGDGPGAEAARLGSDLVRGSAARQQEALEKLRDSKGAAYTEALAAAIPRLGGELKSKARDALADRLSRMTPATLAERLQDPDAELRRAAALACAMKDDRTQVPRLIELLGDKEATVVRAAHAALKALAGKGVDFGPAADATPAEHARATAAWKAWWEKEKAR
jgi:hypothetical protein